MDTKKEGELDRAIDEILLKSPGNATPDSIQAAYEEAERLQHAPREVGFFDDDELPACPHCGRVVLIGSCCSRAGEP